MIVYILRNETNHNSCTVKTHYKKYNITKVATILIQVEISDLKFSDLEVKSITKINIYNEMKVYLYSNSMHYYNQIKDL